MHFGAAHIRSARLSATPASPAQHVQCDATLRSVIRRFNPLPCSAVLDVASMCGALQVGAARLRSALTSSMQHPTQGNNVQHRGAGQRPTSAALISPCNTLNVVLNVAK